MCVRELSPPPPPPAEGSGLIASVNGILLDPPESFLTVDLRQLQSMVRKKSDTFINYVILGEKHLTTTRNIKPFSSMESLSSNTPLIIKDLEAGVVAE